MGPRLSVVVPAYNEEENIDKLYEELTDALDELELPFEILVVDDGSTDQTFATLTGLLDEGHLRVLRLRRNFGQTVALGVGMRHALGDIIVTMDGDLQNDPADIPALLSKLEEGYDCVSGWRRNRHDTLGKKLSSRVSNWLARRLTRLHLHDFGCTLKAYRRECVEALHFHGDAHRYFPAILNARGFQVGEVEVNHRERRFGKSKYGFRRLFRGISDLLALKLWMEFETRPSHLFGPLGLLFVLLGLLLGVYLVGLRLLFDEPLSNRPALLLVVVLVVVGIQFLTLGFMAELLVKTRLNTRRELDLIVGEIRSSEPSRLPEMEMPPRDVQPLSPPKDSTRGVR